MAGFMYFIDGLRRPPRESDLAQHKASHAFDSWPVLAADVMTHGPSGKPGMLLTDESKLDGRQPVFNDNQQTWRQMYGGPMWLGYWNDAKPIEFELRRKVMLPGYRVRLADQAEWQVPLLMQFESEDKWQTVLPQYVDVDEEGHFTTGKVVDVYRHLIELCDRFHTAWLEAIKKTIDTNEQAVFEYDDPVGEATKVLQTNYLIGPYEVAALQLFRNDGTAGDILRAACDCDNLLLMLLKKKARDGSRILDGAKA